MSRRNQGGFTLLEMMIVVAILVIVAGVVISQLSGTEDQAKLQITQSEMGTLRDACLRWKETIGTFPGTPVPPSQVVVTPARSALALSPLVDLVLNVSAASPSPALATVALQPLPDPTAANGSSIQVTVPAWNPVAQHGWTAPLMDLPQTLANSVSIAIPGAGTITLPSGFPTRVIPLRVNSDGMPNTTATGGTPTYVLTTPLDVPPPSGFDPTDGTQRSYYWYSVTASAPFVFQIAVAGTSLVTTPPPVTYP